MPKAGFHRVTAGDNLSVIAARYRVRVSALFRINNLSRRGTIHPGQIIHLPGGAVPVKALAKKPSPAAIPKRMPVPPAFLLAKLEIRQDPQREIDSLDILWEFMYPGMAGVYNEGPPCPLCEFSVAFYRIDFDESNSDKIEIQVLVNETVGHFAEWSGGSSGEIRRLNRISSNIRTGKRLSVPLAVTGRENFRARRIEYHMGIEEDFFNNFVIVGIDSIRVQRGATGWDLCQKYDIPLWLLMKANDAPDGLALYYKQKLQIPIVEEKS